MEGILNTYFSNFHTPTPTFPLPITTPKYSFYRIKPSSSRQRLSLCGAVDEKEPETSWELEFLGENTSRKETLLSPSERRRKTLEKSRLLKGTDSMDWCVNARKAALQTIEARGLSRSMENLVVRKNRKKTKKTKPKRIKKDKTTVPAGGSGDEGDFEELDIDEISQLMMEIDGVEEEGDDDLKESLDTVLEERKARTKAEFVDKLSKFSGPPDRKKEVSLNRSIIDGQTTGEVLEVVSEMMLAVSKGLNPSPLTPLNIATALHRIAKNMEKVSMTKTHRLAFARQRDMSMLVGIAMVALPECSAQGLSNIAWALSKIGGELLYLSEMETTFLRPNNSGVIPFHSLPEDALDININILSHENSERAATKELLGLPLVELERRCRHNGLSLYGGKEMMIARLLNLMYAEKPSGLDCDDAKNTILL